MEPQPQISNKHFYKINFQSPNGIAMITTTTTITSSQISPQQCSNFPSKDSCTEMYHGSHGVIQFLRKIVSSVNPYLRNARKIDFEKKKNKSKKKKFHECQIL